MRRISRGFTLIELLVVVSIVVMLVAILLPALRAVKKNAGAVVCQSNLRQWGQGFAAYTSEHEGLLPYWGHSRDFPDFPTGFVGVFWFASIHAYWPDANDLLLCPLAARYEKPASGWADGRTFRTWYQSNGGRKMISSYGLNGAIGFVDPDGEPRDDGGGWRSSLVKGADKVPVIFDCRFAVVGAMRSNRGPPEYEDIPAPFPAPHTVTCMWPVVINRHNGGINSLFMDWSVRKVGLKELWTLKWQEGCGTAGSWTKAGGVKPEDWPLWMRKFKDY